MIYQERFCYKAYELKGPPLVGCQFQLILEVALSALRRTSYGEFALFLYRIEFYQDV